MRRSSLPRIWSQCPICRLHSPSKFRPDAEICVTTNTPVKTTQSRPNNGTSKTRQTLALLALRDRKTVVQARGQCFVHLLREVGESLCRSAIACSFLDRFGSPSVAWAGIKVFANLPPLVRNVSAMDRSFCRASAKGSVACRRCIGNAYPKPAHPTQRLK